MLVSLMGIQQPSIRYWPSHSHYCWEIVLNLSGSGTMIVNGKDFPFRPGTLCCLPPSCDHSKSSEQGFSDMYLQVFDPRLPSEFMTLDLEADGSISQLMYLMLKTWDISGNSDSQQVLSSLYEALYYLIVASQSAEPRSLAHKLREIMAQNYTDPSFSIGDAYAQLMYNRDYLYRQFLKEYNMSPSQYLIKLRIDYAKQLLAEQSKLHIYEIAEYSGFSDAQYFSRLFKRSVGLTPKEYQDISAQSRSSMWMVFGNSTGT